MPGPVLVERGAVFVIPLGEPSSPAPVAAWATAGGWAKGAERVLGAAWVLGEDSVLSPDQAMARVSLPSASASWSPRRLSHFVPRPVVTLTKDVRKVAAARTQSHDVPNGPWNAADVAFVWQRHELFYRRGIRLGRSLNVPVVLSVHALQVEEAEAWGVARPGWGAWLERHGERPQLLESDLLACVSDEVAEAVARRSVPDSRILVTPNGVDTNHFYPREARPAIRDELNLGDQFVIGWSGSFRQFHGLEQALYAMSSLTADGDSDVTLLLMGEGLHRSRLELEAKRLGLLHSVRFTGSISYDNMPLYLSACDCAIVLGPQRGSFHYSPVKLREYLACGLPVIAHEVGELAKELGNEHEALLIPRNDTAAMVEAVRRLRDDQSLRARLGLQGRQLAERRWSWERPVQTVLSALRQGPGT